MERVENSLGFSLCLPASPPVVPVVTVPFSHVNVDCEVVFSDSGCESVEPQTLSPFRKREASVALERETEMNIEGPPVKAVPKAVRNRPTPQSSPFTAVPECMRSRAPLPQEGTPLRQTATWLGPPADPPVVVNEMEVVDAISDPEFDVIHAWRLRDRVIIRKMEDYLARKREDIWVKVGELEAHLLCPTEVEGVLDLLAWKACDHRGHRKFVSESWPCKTARTAQKQTFFERTVRRKGFATP